MIKNNENVEVDLDDIRFIYFGRKTKPVVNRKGVECDQHIHNGVSCVGYTPIEIDGNITLVMGFAFCSPQDSFSRKKARTVIGNRIKAGKNIVIAVGKLPSYEQTVDLAKGVLTASLPEGVDIEAVEYTKDCPKVGGVNLPRWFDPESL